MTRGVVEGTELKTIFSGIFAEECYTLETKWIRVLGPKEYTDTHSVILLMTSFNKKGYLSV